MELRKRFMRNISRDDINWKNTPLMTKFLNDTGKLYNRYQTRLPTNTQRKVAKTMKKMRDLGILPYVGLVKPTDKIPIGGFIEDVEEMHKKTIDPITGRMFMKHSLQDDLRDKTKREKFALDRKMANKTGNRRTSSKDKKMEELQRDIAREMQLDDLVYLPTKLQREW